VLYCGAIWRRREKVEHECTTTNHHVHRKPPKLFFKLQATIALQQLLCSKYLFYILWCFVSQYNLPDNLPDWASPGNFLGPEGHADLINLVNDPSLYKLCILPLKLFSVGAVTTSSFNLFHCLITLSEKNVDVDQLIHDSFVTSESVLLLFCYD